MKASVHRCRSCSHSNLRLILSLGRTPLTDALLIACSPANRKGLILSTLCCVLTADWW